MHLEDSELDLNVSENLETNDLNNKSDDLKNKMFTSSKNSDSIEKEEKIYESKIEKEDDESNLKNEFQKKELC